MQACCALTGVETYLGEMHPIFRKLIQVGCVNDLIPRLAKAVPSVLFVRSKISGNRKQERERLL